MNDLHETLYLISDRVHTLRERADSAESMSLSLEQRQVMATEELAAATWSACLLLADIACALREED